MKKIINKKNFLSIDDINEIEKFQKRLSEDKSKIIDHLKNEKFEITSTLDTLNNFLYIYKHKMLIKNFETYNLKIKKLKEAVLKTNESSILKELKIECNKLQGKIVATLKSVIAENDLNKY